MSFIVGQWRSPAAVHSELFTARAGAVAQTTACAAAADMILAVKMREHDFMREERRRFKGGGAVGVCAADKLVLAVGLAYQFGVAELADDLAAVALGDDVFQFHTLPR